jgi:hypothetical protein
VRVYERTPGGPVYARTWDSARGLWRKRSLGHRDRPKAKAFAHELHAKLVQGTEDRRKERTTLGLLFALYLRHRTPAKCETEQREDRRRASLWIRVLGMDREPSDITLREWERFVRDRSSGAIDARGNPVPPEKRRPVRARAVERDCTFLIAVCNWGTRWRTDAGYLLRENPVRGFPVPHEKNPRRPVASEDRYERTRAVSDQVAMTVRWSARQEVVRSHLSELLDLANYTGRRLGAIRQLTYADILPDRGPSGSLRFRADADKMGYDSVVPMTPNVRSVIDRVLRERPGIGTAPLFPSPKDLGRSVSRHLCDKWLREAERLAGVEKLEGRLWHAYRAKFATEMVDVPDRVLAKLGGWKAVRTLDLYQQPTDDVMLEALEQRRALREVRQ